MAYHIKQPTTTTDNTVKGLLNVKNAIQCIAIKGLKQIDPMPDAFKTYIGLKK